MADKKWYATDEADQSIEEALVEKGYFQYSAKWEADVLRYPSISNLPPII